VSLYLLHFTYTVHPTFLRACHAPNPALLLLLAPPINVTPDSILSFEWEMPLLLRIN